MTTYRTIASAEWQPQAPVTSELVQALAQNHIATVEGSAGAPVTETAWHEVEVITLGSDGDTITFTTDTSGYRALRLVGGCSIVTATDATANIRINVSGAATFTTITSSTFSGNANTGFMCDLTIDNTDNNDSSGQKIASGFKAMWDRSASTNDWDTNPPTTSTSFLTVDRTAQVCSGVQLTFSADVDVSEGSPTFRLYGIKRTQP